MLVENGGADTRDRILDVAERLFAEMGYGNVSTRMLADEARANSAAVHYHFGSKERLLKALLARTLDPLNEERLAAIRAVLQGASDRPAIADLVRAFAEPLLREPATHTKRLSQTFIGRISLDPSPDVRRILRGSFEDVTKAFTEALSRACPHLSQQDLFWRTTSIQGAIFSCCADNQASYAIRDDVDPSHDPGAMKEFVLPLLGAMMQSPPIGANRHS
jgi:AcrR family transcriptional regulator